MDNPQNRSKATLTYIALGANLGDRLANLQTAIRYLPPQVEVVSQSPIYQTKPWGFEDQPDFLNQVIRAKTTLSPAKLLAYLKEIENKIGRKPSFRFGPRIVDLDILFYADLVIDQPGLKIPHPQLQDRAFVLVPLFDLDPSLRHPVLNTTIRELLSKIDPSEVTLYEP